MITSIIHEKTHTKSKSRLTALFTQTRPQNRSNTIMIKYLQHAGKSTTCNYTHHIRTVPISRARNNADPISDRQQAQQVSIMLSLISILSISGSSGSPTVHAMHFFTHIEHKMHTCTKTCVIVSPIDLHIGNNGRVETNEFHDDEFGASSVHVVALVSFNRGVVKK